MKQASLPTRTLTSEATAAFGWNVAGAVVRAGAALAINTGLARLLGPDPFGQLAIAMVVISLGNLLVESGLGVSLIQKPEIDELDIRYVFTVQMAAGLGLTALVAIVAPLSAAALGQPAVAPVLRALSWMLVIQAFGQTGTALLRRNLDFKGIQKLQMISYLVGYLAIGLPLAAMGRGVWSLVGAQLAQSSIYSAGAWLQTRHGLRPHWSSSRRPLANFGMKIAATNVVSWAVGALPTLLIGRFLGIAQVGLFSRAFFLVNVPASVLASSLQGISLTLYSRMQQHARLTARTCLGLMSLCQMITVPAFFSIAAMSRTIIETLFGDRWLAVAVVLTPFALAMPLDCLASLTSPLLIAKGRPGLEFRVQAATAVSTLAVVGFLASRTSLQTTAWGMFLGVYLIRMIGATIAALRVAEITWPKWATTLAGSAIPGALCFVMVSTMEGRLIAQGMPAWLRLLLLTSLAVATSVSAIYLSPRRIVRKEAFHLLIGGGILSRPSRAHSWAQRLAASRS